MPSSQSYRDYIFEQLAALEDVRCRAMMGEYILYYRDKIVGGIYDDRLLIKDTPAARRLMPDAPAELPYEGAKPMLLVTEIDDRSFLTALLEAIEPELPAPKTKRK